MSPVLLTASGIAYAGIWFLYMASPARRSLRSVLFLLVSSTPLVLAGTTDSAPVFWVAIAAVAVLWTLGMWDLNDILAPMPSSEARIDRRLSNIQEDVWRHRRRLKADNLESMLPDHVALLRKQLDRARATAPPTEEWSRLRSAVIEALESDLASFRGERPLNSTSAEASVATWNDIGRRSQELRRRRSRFWRLI